MINIKKNKKGYRDKEKMFQIGHLKIALLRGLLRKDLNEGKELAKPLFFYSRQRGPQM